MLTVKDPRMGGFMIEYYLSALENYLYRINYVYILSKQICGNMIKKACLSEHGNILSVRDYAENFSAF